MSERQLASTSRILPSPSLCLREREISTRNLGLDLLEEVMAGNPLRTLFSPREQVSVLDPNPVVLATRSTEAIRTAPSEGMPGLL